MILFLIFLLAYQTQLEKSLVTGQFIDIFSDKQGHFLLTTNETIHWDINGSEVTRFNEHYGAILALPESKYIVSYIDLPNYGIKIIDREGRILFDEPKEYSPAFHQIKDTYLGSPKIWTQGKNLLLGFSITNSVPTKNGIDFFKPKLIDPNVKDVWVLEVREELWIVTALEPSIYIFKSGKLKAKVDLDIDGWRGWKGRLRGPAKDAPLWFSGFDRISGAGMTKDGLMISVEQESQTSIYLFKNGNSLELITNTQGWGTSGDLFTGTDEIRGWIINPQTLVAKQVN